ncbi:lytic transglycosylase domain-containing protein (plasmid) [Asticcacaulis sp. DW145]|uniref:lytic transglycosylase domain-containing protein n=1 Tax=Asticcacaulis sp. DW145 TaxID=3095608 RepID=UPI003092BF34|nr:lytic transglycosylase domain-containing protein [Asticcacaulis sp. DW145]
MPLSFLALAQACAPGVHPATLERVVRVESSYNPYAIGVVNGKLTRQPNSLPEAVATVARLEKAGYNYSLGLAQVNKKNLKAHGLTIETAFDPCENLRAGSQILIDCYETAGSVNPDPQGALRDALSCYYSGDLKRGHRLGYVAKIERAMDAPRPSSGRRRRDTPQVIPSADPKSPLPTGSEPNAPNNSSSLLF